MTSQLKKAIDKFDFEFKKLITHKQIDRSLEMELIDMIYNPNTSN